MRFLLPVLLLAACESAPDYEVRQDCVLVANEGAIENECEAEGGTFEPIVCSCVAVYRCGSGYAAQYHPADMWRGFADYDDAVDASCDPGKAL